MIFGGFEICCPACRGELSDDGTRERVLHCGSCDAVYPVIAGIPDLRVADDPYITREADRAKAARVAEHFHETDFPGLIGRYYAMTPAVPPADALRYTRGLIASEGRARASLAAWESAAGTPLRGDTMLDIGCGTAPLMVPAAERFTRTCGVDIALRWLVVARKRLDDAGIGGTLICAGAEALPFPDDSFDFSAGESFLETVHDQDRTLDEIRRTLRPGGRFALSTPNRFSLGPDPHVGIWAGGYLPDRVIAAYVKRRGGVPPRRSLLSARQLRGRLHDHGFEHVRVLLPDIPESQRRALPPHIAPLVALYQALARMPGTRRLLFVIGPLLLAVGSRHADAPDRRQEEGTSRTRGGSHAPRNE